MIKRPRGTQDIYNRDSAIFDFIVSSIESIAKTYGHQKIITPIFESTELFNKGLGEDAEILTKEIYTFEDRKGRSLSLRPEGTASVVRAYLENKLYAKKLNKFYYTGQMFRYERPQAGRQREFNQFGAEVIGVKNPLYDVEIILMAQTLLEFLKIENIQLKINSLGNEKTRIKYTEQLKKHLSNLELCNNCEKNLESNPLRILDCKECNAKNIFNDIPQIEEFYDQESLEYFNDIKNILDQCEVNYIIDSKLVRGLDYYNDLIFEFIYTGSENAQNTIIGGGRYDSLIENFGHKESIPAIGFAIGVERMKIAFENENEKDLDSFDEVVDVYFAPLSEEAQFKTLSYMDQLRKIGVVTSSDFTTIKLNNHFKMSERNFAAYTIIIGDEELSENQVVVKNMIDKSETKTKFINFIEMIKNE